MCYEYDLIILLSKPWLNKQEESTLVDIVKKVLDWDLIYDKLQRHRIVPIAYHHIKTNKLELYIPRKILNTIKKEFETNKIKQEVYFEEVKPIFKEFKKSNLKFCVLKGVVLQELLYPKFTRMFKDVDILIYKEDYGEVLKILKKYDFSNEQDSSIKRNKRERVFLLLNTYEFPNFNKEIIVNNQSIKLQIDLQHMHTLATKMKYSIETLEELKCSEEMVVNKIKINRQRLDYLLIHLCTHTFGDCTTISEIVLKKAFRLRNFADIVSLADMFSSFYLSDDFYELVKKTNTAQPVYFCLYYCKQIYQVSELFAKIVEKIGSLLSDYKFLEQCGFEDGVDRVIVWEAPLMDKMFSEESINEVKEKAKNSIKKYACYDTRFDI